MAGISDFEVKDSNIGKFVQILLNIPSEAAIDFENYFLALDGGIVDGIGDFDSFGGKGTNLKVGSRASFTIIIKIEMIQNRTDRLFNDGKLSFTGLQSKLGFPLRSNKRTRAILGLDKEEDANEILEFLTYLPKERTGPGVFRAVLEKEEQRPFTFFALNNHRAWASDAENRLWSWSLNEDAPTSLMNIN